MVDELDQIEEIDVKALMDDLTKAFSQLPPEVRAYKVINNFFRVENPSEEMCDRFYEWLLDQRNQRAKKMAMERVVTEHFEKLMA